MFIVFSRDSPRISGYIRKRYHILGLQNQNSIKFSYAPKATKLKMGITKQEVQ